MFKYEAGQLVIDFNIHLSIQFLRVGIKFYQMPFFNVLQVELFFSYLIIYSMNFINTFLNVTHICGISTKNINFKYSARFDWLIPYFVWGFPGGASGNEPTCQCRRHKRHRVNPWGGHGNPLQYSCLENPID